MKISYDDIPVNINTLLSDDIYIKGKNFEPGYYKLYIKDYMLVNYSSITTYTNLNLLESSIEKKYFDEDDIGLIIYLDDSIHALTLDNIYLVKLGNKTDIKTELENDCYLKGKDFEPGYYKLEYSYFNSNYNSNSIFSVYSNTDLNNIIPNDIIYNDHGNIENLDGKYFYIDDSVEEIKLVNTKLTKVDDQVDIKTTLTDGYYLRDKDFEPGYYIFNVTDEYYSGLLKTFSKENFSTTIGSISVGSYNYDKYNGKVIYIDDNVGQIRLKGATLEKIELSDLRRNNDDGNGLLIMNQDVNPSLYLFEPFDDNNDCILSEVSINNLNNSIKTSTLKAHQNAFYTLPDNIKYIEMNNCKIREVNEQNKFTPTSYTLGHYYLMNYSFEPGYYMVTSNNGIAYQTSDENFNQIDYYNGYNQKYDLFYFSDNITYLLMNSGSMVRVPYDEKIDDDTLFKYDYGTYSKEYIVGEDISTGHYLVEWVEPEGGYGYTIKLYDSNNNVILDTFGSDNDKLIEITDDVYKVYIKYCTLKKVD